jgi:hypothetical protein
MVMTHPCCNAIAPTANNETFVTETTQKQDAKNSARGR